ncbi:MAG: invasion associated locus B family protein [Pseudomonadota bacterium]
MSAWTNGAVAAVFAWAVLAAGAGWSQAESTNRVAAKTDWSVFVEENPKECWGVSAPKSAVVRRGGEVDSSAQRGDILLFVTFRPGSGAAGEISYTGGYPFAPDSTVEVQVAGQTYDLFTDGEWAWPATPEADAEIVTALKAGAEATVVGRSSRGAVTTDQFSLMGFTAAMDDAESRCAN